MKLSSSNWYSSLLKKTARAMWISGLFLLATACGNFNRSQFYHPADFDPVKTTYFVWSDAFYGIIPELAGIIS
ncbi:MAG: hypothetical protein K9J30_13235 [Bacteroidales bacterium]|nr:hypothetical protein [Bacteroidales bacterium]